MSTLGKSFGQSFAQAQQSATPVPQAQAAPDAKSSWQLMLDYFSGDPQAKSMPAGTVEPRPPMHQVPQAVPSHDPFDFSQYPGGNGQVGGVKIK